MCPSSGLWEGVLDCDSQFTILSPQSFDGPQRRYLRLTLLSTVAAMVRKLSFFLSLSPPLSHSLPVSHCFSPSPSLSLSHTNT